MALARLLLALGILLFMFSLVIPAGAQGADEFDIPNGRFFTQTRGSAPAGHGFAVTDNDGVPFYTWFRRYGGVSAVGYPVSHRFHWKGFISQAFQKVVFQWRPDQGGVVTFVNVFDELSAAGKDNWLAVARDVPISLKWEEDRGKSWDEIVRNHFALLERDRAIKDVFLGAADPIAFNGLPMAYEDRAHVSVLRAQRRVFQRWKTDQPWARAGQVTVANGGDVGKEAGLYPQEAITPRLPNDAPRLVLAATPTPNPTATPTVPAVTRPAGPTPNPVHPACGRLEHEIEKSLAKNATMDEGYTNGVPNGWTWFGSGNVRSVEETGYEKFGRASWLIEGSGEFVGGGYQVIPVTPGKWYQAFYATAQLVYGNGRRDGSLPLLREIGLDPTGGTNPNAPTVIWGRSSGGQPDRDAGKYGGWKTMGNNNNPLVSMIAVTTRMTLFIRVRGWPDVDHGKAWIESVQFFEACDPAFRR
ncbi:MAG: hypothetical protein RMM58_11600 [Chloroflexota bacterium]|nr:hypothetical protein [Dehalococcoidia bacterium]MDW8254509.1 hypothetical protein [Chloroflexota bacterium]